MSSGANAVNHTGWRTPLTGNNNLQWPILPALLALGAVAANQHFKVVDWDDRWTAFSGVAAGMNLNLIFGISSRCHDIPANATDIPANATDILNALGELNPTYLDLNEYSSATQHAIKKAFPNAYCAPKEVYEGDDDSAQRVSDLLNNKQIEAVVAPITVLYQKPEAGRKTDYAIGVLAHCLLNVEKIESFDLVRAREGILGDQAIEFVRKLPNLKTVRCAVEDVEAVLDNTEVKRLIVCTKDGTLPPEGAAKQSIEAAGFMQVGKSEIYCDFVRAKEIAALNPKLDTSHLEFSELNLSSPIVVN